MAGRNLLAKQQPENIPLADVPGQALRNLPSSAAQFGSDIVAPFVSPVETAKNIGSIVLGAVQKLIPGEQGSEQHADAVGQFFKERYGGFEEFKRTVAKDPVGVLADISMLVTGGGSAAARLPGVIGKAGRATAQAGRAIDPVSIAAKGGGVAADIVGGIGTRTGGRSLRDAGQSGFEGGAAGESLRNNMRGVEAVDSVVGESRNAVANLHKLRGIEYRAGMKAVGKNAEVLDFNRIDAEIAKVAEVGQFKGIDISESTAAVRKAIDEKIDAWKKLDPEEFHTAEGMDALKQSIGDIRDVTEFGSPSRVVANGVYRSIRAEIVKQSPEYAKVMKGYEQASDLIQELEKTLSLNPKANIDTTLRKLQSILRNNVNTNYGRREQLGIILQDAGAEHLMAKLSGQALRPLTPRGLGPLVAGGTVAGGLVNPAVLGALPFQSPRLMGEVFHGAGRVAGAVDRAAGATRLSEIGITARGAGAGAFQAGRIAGVEER